MLLGTDDLYILFRLANRSILICWIASLKVNIHHEV